MRLYEEIIAQWQSLLDGLPVRSLPLSDGWPDTGSRNMILRSDMAYELGGENLPALGATAVTAGGFAQDEILLCGPDLPEIRKDVPYARLTVASVRDGLPDQGSALYQAIKKIDFVRYHVNPEGFMTRISAIQGRESARVSRNTLKKGLTFSQAGGLMVKSYHENPQIQAVRLIYITDSAFPFGALEETIQKGREITRAIDHAMTAAMTDCNVCSLKKVCDEVEGIRQLHFGQERHESIV